MNNLTAEKLLKLDDLKIFNEIEYTDEYGHPAIIFECESTKDRPSCPNCNSSILHGNGIRQRDLRDLDVMGYHTTLRIHAKSFVCQDCKRSFVEQFPKLTNPNSRMTLRFRDYLGKEALNYTFDELAYKHTISPTLVSTAFREWIEEQDSEREDSLYAPRVLGIDEAHLCPESRRKEAGMRGVFIDVDNKTVLDLTTNRDKKTVINWLSKLKNPETLEIVTIDMWEGYKNAVYEVFKDKVKVVIDHYHVIQELLIQMQRARNNVYSHLPEGTLKNHQNNLSLLKSDLENFDDEMKLQMNRLFKAVPDIKLVFGLKESFRAIYYCQTRAEAEEAFEKWCKQIPNTEDFKPFKSFEKTVRRWHKEIFNFFDCDRVSNATTESLNGIIKKINRKGNGYSFDVLRAKVLYGAGRRNYYPGIRKTKVKVYKPSSRKPDPSTFVSFIHPDFATASFETIEQDEQITKYGVSVRWLEQEVESNAFFVRWEKNNNDK